MASLVDLLGDFSRRGSGTLATTFADSLDSLETEARQNNAPSETIAAIRGVRMLFNLAELPPLPPLANG